MVSQTGQFRGQGPEEEKCIREENSDTNGKTTLLLFFWIVSLKNRDKSEKLLLDTKQPGSKLFPQSDLQGWGGMLLEEIP